jgi:disulfide bond formation protein DsbB
MNLYLFQRIIGFGVLILQVFITALIIYLIYRKISKKKVIFIEKIFSDHGMFLVGLSVSLAFISSLIFSDIYHIEACKLCWLQRVALYPQIIIMFIASKKRDVGAWTYSLWLSTIGLVIAVYQTLEQFRIKALPQANCVIGPDAACSQINMLEFGYITLPLASATLFIFIIILYFLRKESI